MNSKEEILKKHCTIFNEGSPTEWVDSPPKRIYAAMDEYRSIGEREMAIRFAEWIDRNQYRCMGNDGDWRESNGAPVASTTEQLYELFKQSL